ncbi:RES family NAD+ phosphorylase [Spongiibacter sp. KMU-166]|uniref:RES family NAD+ phosphorylase n=1 Tax=Spongiibacter thalassae TaxID=2721624 RepID=A0ABX1GFQ6_9GAMM|nr:RES domain-containing protein [Spongiibacter thalassae]NKI17976.1 RES family NAD+ phosphorylase [Spongiibacter thalassae]
MSDFYDENSLFCTDCTSDRGLQAKIQLCSMKGNCSICHTESVYVVTFRELATWLEEIWREWYHIGEYQPVVRSDSDRVDYEQRGDEPNLLLGELVDFVRDEEEVLDTLIELMSEGDTYEVMQGGEALIDSCQCYQKRKLYLAQVEYRWEVFVRSLKHHTRYFNNSAKEFFDCLFDGIQEVHSWELPQNSQDLTNYGRRSNQPVVIEYAPRSMPIFRARKATSDKVFQAIVDDPDVELSNPPDEFATEGRMNPKGISYFYGAADRETCVAELRPSIGEQVISGEFELTEKVVLLDLTLLSTSYHRKIESMFEDDYLEKRIDRELLRQLERLIAQPVLDGDEFDYLPTQAMSEYLARHATPRIDGIVFNSVQRAGGKNIVLFPHILRKDNHSSDGFGAGQSGIKVKPESLIHHQVKRITHETTERDIVDRELAMFFDYPDDDFDYFF